MNRSLALLAVGCLISIAASRVPAAELNLAWFDPGSYRDIEPTAGESDEAFRQRLFEALGSHLRELAARLPAERTLHLTVTDLDLAGDVEPGIAATGYRKMRMVSEMYPPRIAFSFQLRDGTGAVILQGDEQLKGRPLPVPGMRIADDSPFPAERAMLDGWFEKRFSE